MIDIKKFNKGKVYVIDQETEDFLKSFLKGLTEQELTKLFSHLPKEQRKQIAHLILGED